MKKRDHQKHRDEPDFADEFFGFFGDVIREIFEGKLRRSLEEEAQEDAANVAVLRAPSI